MPTRSELDLQIELSNTLHVFDIRPDHEHTPEVYLEFLRQHHADEDRRLHRETIRAAKRAVMNTSRVRNNSEGSTMLSLIEVRRRLEEYEMSILLEKNRKKAKKLNAERRKQEVGNPSKTAATDPSSSYGLPSLWAELEFTDGVFHSNEEVINSVTVGNDIDRPVRQEKHLCVLQ